MRKLDMKDPHVRDAIWYLAMREDEKNKKKK